MLQDGTSNLQMFGDSPLQAINRQIYNSFQFHVRPLATTESHVIWFLSLSTVYLSTRWIAKKCELFWAVQIEKWFFLTSVLILHTLKLNLVRILSFTFKADLSCTRPKSKPCPTSLQHVQTQRLVRPLLHTFKRLVQPLVHVQTQNLVRPSL